jgi:hypothetical protein
MKNNIGGFGLIEIVVASALISASLFTLTTASQFAFKAVDNSVQEAKANFLLEEGIEVVRILRDLSWMNNVAILTNSVIYFPSFDTGQSKWDIVSTDPGAIDGVFTRTVIFEEVSRDTASHDIVTSGGDPDNFTKKVTITVSWVSRGDRIKTKSMSTYITDLFQN